MEVEGIGTLRNTLGPVVNANTNLRFTAPTQRPLPERLTDEQLQAVRQRTTPPSAVTA
jgi:hypothetical protein